jgi:DNA helicase-2/ATP-dependent DNA helicase PcrA
MSGFQPRPGQREVLAYRSGKMGISAVPGSGKTSTLAELAARLVAERIGEGQEVLIVTLVNSAVDNFKRRINRSVVAQGLLPNFGYRVRTLHGLAHDIVRDRPALVGLSEDFGIIDEREAATVRDDAVEAWLDGHPDVADRYLQPDLEGNRADWVRRTRWPRRVRDIVTAFIKQAKDNNLAAEVLLERLTAMPARGWVPAGGHPLHLARMATDIYADYQRSLAYRGVVDFEDLIRLALEALHRDPDYLARLQARWPYILEDEAQDSSKVQERMLRLLSAGSSNWVRVGDANQAIYDTFTNANPTFLRDYLQESDVTEVLLRQSGRSQPAIIELANYLVNWTADEHPTHEVRGAFVQQYIQATGPEDPQPNPPMDRRAVQVVDQDLTPDAELRAVTDSLERWLPDHPDHTVAVLVPRNERGAQLIRLLQARSIDYVELLRSTSDTRQTAGALGNLLRCPADPTSARKLSVAFRVWRRDERDDPEADGITKSLAGLIASCPAVEAYLWPQADHDWLAPLVPELPAAHVALLTAFAEMARRWHQAAILPIDQLILTLAGDLFQEPSQLALAHKLAVLLRDVAQAHPAYRLPELVEELEVIARNERRFLGFSKEDTDFEPPRGKVTVTTMHKAKGMEWDRVYLMSVNNYNFPAGQAHDTYISEPWFIRDDLNLEAEALAQLQILAAIEPRTSGSVSPAEAGSAPQDVLENQPEVHSSLPYMEGDATRRARLDYVAERLRLLYVGITRARRELVLTWNTGRRREAQAAAALLALSEYWVSPARQEPDIAANGDAGDSDRGMLSDE